MALTVKEIYQRLGELIEDGYGDCVVTTNLENDGYVPSYNFIDEVDTYLDRNKMIVNLYEC